MGPEGGQEYASGDTQNFPELKHSVIGEEPVEDQEDFTPKDGQNTPEDEGLVPEGDTEE